MLIFAADDNIRCFYIAKGNIYFSCLLNILLISYHSLRYLIIYYQSSNNQDSASCRSFSRAMAIFFFRYRLLNIAVTIESNRYMESNKAKQPWIIEQNLYNYKAKRLQVTTFAVSVFRRAITIWEAIQKRSHKLMYKTGKKLD